MEPVLGVDIGGANLKAANTLGQAVTLAFPLWKQPEKLTGGLIDLLLRFPDQGPIAVTMTGELCDCYGDKSEGVRHIVQSMQSAAGERPLYLWRNDGKWAGAQHAQEDPRPVASANWLASATFAGRFLPDGWFLDLGSTTLDLLPLRNGKVMARGKSDLERLKWGELAYLGATRTPVCAITKAFSYQGRTLWPAAEFFATTQDVYVLQSKIPEDPSDRATADGRPRTRENARRRLAKMFCSDPQELGDAFLQDWQESIVQEHRRLLLAAVDRAAQSHEQSRADFGYGVIFAGSGEWLLAAEAPAILNTLWPGRNDSRLQVLSISSLLGAEISSALCAYSVAMLLRGRFTA